MSLAPKGIQCGKSQANDSGQSTAKDAYDVGQEAVAAQRPDVDALIKDLWDSIAFALRADEPSSLRRKAREWGVFYLGDEETSAPPTAGTVRVVRGRSRNRMTACGEVC